MTMKRDQFIREIKRARGPIYAAVSAADEVYYVQIVKADAIELFTSRFQPDEETGLEISERAGQFYIDKDFGA
jgi:hypothetical protein